MREPRRDATLLVLVALAACGGHADAPAVTVTDSAGVRITLSRDAGATYATVDPEPLVSLGGPSSEGPEQFYRITNVQLDGEGRIWVSDWQSGELRVFGADGSHLLTRGGRGDGPGEFRAVRLVGEFEGDSVLVVDQANGRLAIYDTHADLVRSGRLEAGDGAYPRPFDVYPDGSVLGQVPLVLQSDVVPEGELLPVQVTLERFSMDHGPVPLLEGSTGTVWLSVGRRIVPIPFTANPAFALRDEELHFAAGPDFRVQVYVEDRLVRVYGVERDPFPVTQRDVDRYRETVVAAYPEERQGEMLSALEHPTVPAVLPAYTHMVIADDGHVWVSRFSPDLPWDVYAPAGELLGNVDTPAGFVPMSIRGGLIAGVWLDDLDVEHVRVYAVRRAREG